MAFLAVSHSVFGNLMPRIPMLDSGIAVRSAAATDSVGPQVQPLLSPPLTEAAILAATNQNRNYYKFLTSAPFVTIDRQGVRHVYAFSRGGAMRHTWGYAGAICAGEVISGGCFASDAVLSTSSGRWFIFKQPTSQELIWLCTLPSVGDRMCLDMWTGKSSVGFSILEDREIGLRWISMVPVF
jgi:hypothetical protein